MEKKMSFFDKYLTVWVALCMGVGIGLGKLVPDAVASLRGLEFGEGSQINIPIAILIWLMVYPMMLKVDFSSVLNVGKNPKGLFVTLFVNWIVKPFSMALLGYIFFRLVFSPWITASEADQYIAGSIILAAAPCTAMVFVWSYLTDGDPGYTLVQVSVNDLLMLVLFAPIVKYLVAGASNLIVPFSVLFTSVVVFIVIPLGCRRSHPSVVVESQRQPVVQRDLSADSAPGGNLGALGHLGTDLRLPGGQYYRSSFPCPAHRHPDHHPGVFQFVSGL